MKALLQWFDDRTGLGPAVKQCWDRPMPGKACCCKVWPSAILFAFCTQAITGFFLWVYYSPSRQTAWESVYYLQHQVAGGWLLRAIHHYSAHVLLALLICYLLQMIVTGAYRAPRELVFWAALGMAMCALAAMLTGDLLCWDRNGYASTLVRTGFLTLLPGIGDSLFPLAIGGPPPDLGHLAITRFFALHAGLFSAAFLLLSVLHGILLRRAGAKQCATAQVVTRLWPEQAFLNSAACLLVLAVVLVLACQHSVTGDHAGAALGSPASSDPADRYEAARPEWFLLGVYEFSHLFPGEWAVVPIFVVPGLLFGLLLAMPFIAQWRVGQIFNVAIVLVLLIAVVLLSYHSMAKDAADPKYRAAVAGEKRQAERVG
ncbi:MAG: cytochrome b N-terminal domain-containing protein, partial [Candidatus Hydrogenedentes bacterium]|nr:cytochrome b N-terminal domain-containing protein [Candidatus Hydrogenedentota bacterium]